MNLLEEIARIAAPHMEGGREFDQCPPDRIVLRKWAREGMCSFNDATQEDALDLARSLLPIIEKVAQAAIDAAAEAVQYCVNGYPLDDIRALSASEIVKEMRGE